jgi:hypothetical protein
MNTLGALPELLIRDEFLNKKSSLLENERNLLNRSFVHLYLLAGDWNSFALHWTAQTVSNLHRNFHCEKEICLIIGGLKNIERDNEREVCGRPLHLLQGT